MCQGGNGQCIELNVAVVATVATRNAVAPASSSGRAGGTPQICPSEGVQYVKADPCQAGTGNA